MMRGGQDGGKDQTLVAYVVPGTGSVPEDFAGGEAAEEQLTQWQSVFDAAFSPATPEADPRFDISGWISSYTGRLVPAAEMREWVDRTVERIQAFGPRRVLEIGCGTGLLLLRLAPNSERYVGTDFSVAALTSLRSVVARDEKSAGVDLLNRRADDLSGLEKSGLFDTIVLNSVVQYFPDIDYLVRVLKGAASLLAPCGRIFIGDVRSFSLLQAFHLAVELKNAPSSLSIQELKQLLPLRLLQEEELAIDPAFFKALRGHLPRIGQVDCLLKRGVNANEMAQFRYDVILHREEQAPPCFAHTILDWAADVGDLASLRRILGAVQGGTMLRIFGVPNRRIAGAVHAARVLDDEDASVTVEGLRGAAAAAELAAIDPEPIWALGKELDCGIDICPGADPEAGLFDIVCRRRGSPENNTGDDVEEVMTVAAASGRALRLHANDPLCGRRMRQLGPLLREFLRRSLPDYMIPGFFVVLPALPLTTNGKIDLRALPAPGFRGTGDDYVPPESPAQEILVAIWTEVLGISRIGIHDNFFELGGHSLLATQVLSRLRKAFRMDFPLRSLFEAPTPAGLAEIVETRLIEQLNSLSEEEAKRMLEQAATVTDEAVSGAVGNDGGSARWRPEFDRR